MSVPWTSDCASSLTDRAAPIRATEYPRILGPTYLGATWNAPWKASNPAEATILIRESSRVPWGRSDKRGARRTATTHRKEMQRRGATAEKKGAESIWWPSPYDGQTRRPAFQQFPRRELVIQQLSRGAFQASTAPCLRRGVHKVVVSIIIYIYIYKRLLPLAPNRPETLVTCVCVFRVY
jgi:hypothetical protein